MQMTRRRRRPPPPSWDPSPKPQAVAGEASTAVGGGPKLASLGSSLGGSLDWATIKASMQAASHAPADAPGFQELQGFEDLAAAAEPAAPAYAPASPPDDMDGGPEGAPPVSGRVHEGAEAEPDEDEGSDLAPLLSGSSGRRAEVRRGEVVVWLRLSLGFPDPHACTAQVWRGDLVV